VRLDPRVLDWLKSKGEGHLTRINDILTNLIEAERSAGQGRVHEVRGDRNKHVKANAGRLQSDFDVFPHPLGDIDQLLQREFPQPARATSDTRGRGIPNILRPSTWLQFPIAQHVHDLRSCQSLPRNSASVPAFPYLEGMEVHFTPETEKKLKDLSAQSGRGTDNPVEDAMAGYFDGALGSWSKDAGWPL